MTEKSLEGFIRKPEGPVVIFYWPFITIVAALLILGILINHASLAILSSIFLITTLISLGWSEFSFNNIKYKGILNEYRAFPGETVQFEIQVLNKKPLPLGWLDIYVDFPSKLLTKNAPLRVLTYIPWFRKMRWCFPIYCTSRGYYPIGPITMSSGDVFGFFTKSIKIYDIQYLIVYPKIIPLQNLYLPLKHHFGEKVSLYTLFEDPSRFSGVREYRQEDAFKKIHWKASARLRKLQVKTYEATMALSLIILLDIESFKDKEGRLDMEKLEWGISIAASLAYDALKRKIPVGLLMNGNNLEGGDYVKVAVSRSPNQLTRILECLAKLQPYPSLSFKSIIDIERDKFPNGVTLVFVINSLNEQNLTLILNLKAHHKVAILYVGEEDLGLLFEKITIIPIKPQGGAYG
ncbi:MAG: DUF58 domain-containing protein [Nitrososphaerales archaeon]